jgi:hypothetical protein
MLHTDYTTSTGTMIYLVNINSTAVHIEYDMTELLNARRYHDNDDMHFSYTLNDGTPAPDMKLVSIKYEL